MAPIHEGLENKSFPAAGSEQKSVSICMDSGLRATEACLNDPRGSRARTFTLFSDDVPAETCSLHKEVEVCTGSPVLGGDGTAIEGDADLGHALSIKTESGGFPTPPAPGPGSGGCRAEIPPRWC